MEEIIENTRSFVRPLVRQLARGRKKRSKALRKWLSFRTAQMRVMPDFIIIGAQKCGTSSLRDYLKQHLYVAFSLDNEVHFFDANFVKGTTWYRAQFPTFLYRDYVKNMHGHDLISGEKSPYYIFHPLAPKRILDTIPQVKLIVMLRNPVDRAYSHYHHQVKRGRETLSFEEAIEAEPQRLKGELEKILEDGDYTSFNHVHFSYLTRGIYVDQLKVWMSLFPKERILILNSEDFFADPSPTFRRVLEFLSLPDWELREYRRSNVGRYPKMQATTRGRLVEFFKPHNQRLYEYLEMSFDWDSG